MRECNTLALGAAQLGIALSARAVDALLAHLELLAQWNRRMNLTAVRDFDAMVIRHTLDSLSIAKFVRGDSILDLGSGAGLPGVPLAVAQPHRHVTLLDSRLRRVEFLRAVVAELQLDNAEVVRARVEAHRPARKFDTLTARAFAPLPRMLQLTRRLHHPGARLLAMKGRAPVAEIAQVAGAKSFTGTVTDTGTTTGTTTTTVTDTGTTTGTGIAITVHKLEVPFLQAERHLVVAEF